MSWLIYLFHFHLTMFSIHESLFLSITMHRLPFMLLCLLLTFAF
uniref:Uncharacterized protein n=1 Tax=Rhizophora mucronata TaxID=61149 RepID=A0A2P2Q9S0_RHIMU